MDKLKEIESKLTDLIQVQSKNHYGPVPPYPLILLRLILELTQEVIKVRQMASCERRDWGRMHT